MIGMALAAVLLCVNLTSCDKDDDELTGGTSGGATNTPGNGGYANNGEKKLAKIMEYRIEDGYKKLSESIEFVYGENGNVVKTIEGWRGYDSGNWNTDTYEYIWNSNYSFTVSWDEDDDDYEKFVIDNGRISKQIWIEDDYRETYYLKYDKGQLKEYGEYYEDGEQDTYLSLSWSDGKLVSITESERYTTSFLYGEKTCKKGFFPLLNYLIEGFDENYIFTAQPELVGLKMTYLPTQMISDYSTTTFEYELDSDGYIVGCTTSESWEYNIPTNRHYAFFWE